MNWWRLSSTSKLNISLGLAAHVWGGPSGIGLQSLEQGDKIVWYVSKGRDLGYWGISRVERPMFKSGTSVWPDGDYPFRIGIDPTHALREAPVTSEQVRVALGRHHLVNRRSSGVIRLSKEEYDVIAKLLRAKHASAIPRLPK